ncbi:MAG: hypothetical protein NC217_07540 [Muribaculaceae bacterium]|nr:hypothetical protein [Muribaculaceae bacterium]
MKIDKAMTYPPAPASNQATQSITTDSSLTQAIATLVNEQAAAVQVKDGPEAHTLTAWQALQGVAQMLPYSDEYSDIEISCPIHLYSASALTLAAEDADAPVISLLAYPGEYGLLTVFMRINRTDPSQAVRSLERHGYTVTHATGPENADEELSRERLEELQHYLNI